MNGNIDKIESIGLFYSRFVSIMVGIEEGGVERFNRRYFKLYIEFISQLHLSLWVPNTSCTVELGCVTVGHSGTGSCGTVAQNKAESQEPSTRSEKPSSTVHLPHTHMTICKQ